MNLFNERRASAIGLSAILALALVTACTDVGDSSAGPGAQDAMGADVTVSDDGSSTPSADATEPQQDATQPDAVGAEGSVASEPDAPADSTTVDTGVGETGADAGADAAAGEAGGLDATVDSSSLDTGVADTGTESSTDTGVAEAGGQEAGGGTVVPCTTASQTNCIACDQNASHLCTGTDAVIVQRDIEKGFTSGGKPSAGSCYECLAARTCIDSTTTRGSDCEDLNGFVANSTTYTLTQSCLDTLNCTLGNPQAGTPGTGGAPGSLATTTCSNDPPPGDGTANCFCGTAEPDFNDCSTADKIAAGTTGQGLGTDSPNGVCDAVIVKALGVTNNTSNAIITTDLGDNTNGVGQAFLILNCGGATSDPVACPQCYQ